MSRNISTIKMNDKSVTVKYFKHHMTKEDDVRNTILTVKSEVKPHIQFFEQFQKMKQYAIAFMELSAFKNKVDESVLAQFVVTSVSISEDTDSTKVMVAMTRVLKNGRSYSLKSPLIDLADEEFTELEELNICFDNLVSEAESYLEGKNGEEQMEIQFDVVEKAA